MSNLENYVIEIHNASDAIEDPHSEYNIDGICTDLIEHGYYGSDITAGNEPDPSLFWAIVQNNAR